MPGIARQHRQIDAELGKRPSPFSIVIGSKHNLVIRRYTKPAISLDLGIELTWRPAGIAERKKALLRPLIPADRAQDLKRRRYVNIAVNSEGRLFLIVGCVEHKASTRFH